MIQLFIAFLTSLPEILKLIKELQKVQARVETQRKIKDDIRVISESFNKLDAAKLNQLFSGAKEKDDDLPS